MHRRCGQACQPAMQRNPLPIRHRKEPTRRKPPNIVLSEPVRNHRNRPRPSRGGFVKQPALPAAGVHGDKQLNHVEISGHYGGVLPCFARPRLSI